MKKYIDLSDTSVALVGIRDTLEDCQIILDNVKSSDENSRTLILVLKDKLTEIDIEVSELQKP
ncbi:Uncharacterised protein [Klebsiella pneumoniae subsp. ozaenae]|uniref:Uncharacterized protein n=1 Tax=Klebsiella pneumoniae subsp. ozaenae TaxID=574 RepID=A0A377ZH74_KLEPO|nr:Uncharacterised protein [Klebsiella pneumoniae]STU07580.1 Uncharacterised protein [Klebsiella pneumoniae]STU67808.1 Uncharacterised protein [Klebsiella pneumoniae subsp. ozaenae]